MSWLRKCWEAEPPKPESRKHRQCGDSLCCKEIVDSKSQYCAEHKCGYRLPNGGECEAHSSGFEYCCALHGAVVSAKSSARANADKFLCDGWSDFAVTLGDHFIRAKVRPTAKEHLAKAARCRDAKSMRYADEEVRAAYRVAFSATVVEQLREHYLLMPDEITELLAGSGQYGKEKA